MADYESSIRIDIDSAAALAAIKSLQKQISAFHSSIAKGSSSASVATANLQKDLVNNINATGRFSASMTGIRTTTESFTNALEKNKLSMGEYFRFAGGASKKFGKSFGKEFDVINKVARERVKDLQTQYIQMGRDANGAMQAIKVRPLSLDMNHLGTQTQIAAQRQQLFNQVLKQGSTNLLNFGKNVQWSGRQLMVGFTIPLSIMATAASREFMKIERQAIRFKRVYGDAFSTPEGTEEALKNVKQLASEFTKYGVELEKTMELAADAAQMGLSGAALSAQITQATRLSVLGEVSQQEALKTTVSVMNAFGIAAGDLASKIDFLNAVENETMTAISDLTIAIPKAAPVVRQLGGSVEDLAFFLTAMKEGGINASEGANALKSGLASLINPTKQSSDMLKSFGINITRLVESNKGDVKGLVIDFAMALDELDPLNRARAIEQLFGKFQFSRISTLFQNVIAEGGQTARVLELTGSSLSDLAKISERELGNVAESSMFKFQKAVEDLKVSVAPIGEQFLKAITPVLEFGTKILTQFNNMGDGVKNFVVIGGAILAGLGPIFLMTFGLIANGVANIIKGFASVRGMFLKTKDSSNILGEQLSYMSTEQIEAAAVASSLERAHAQLEQRFTSEAAAVQALVAAYERGIKAQAAFSGLPRVASAQAQAGAVRGYNSGVVSVPGPRGAGDVVPAMLTPGEAVIPAKAAQKYAPIIKGMIAGNLPGFNKGVMLGMPKTGKSIAKNRDSGEMIYQEFLKSSYSNVPPTNYGHQIAATTGRSFPIWGLGGVYTTPGGNKVFVKPVMDETAAIAEMRGTQIARQAHGLEAPEQRIVVIADPHDPQRKRRYLALESDLDAKFVNKNPNALFNEEQYFRQLVASLVRVDKDLAAGNMFGNVVADVGPAGVFNKASGVRGLESNLPSMEEQAMINLLGIKGGAKRAFAESTVGLMSRMTAEQYHQYMIAEIQRVLPSLKQTIAGFDLANPAEADAYAAMIKRLEQGLGVNWSRFHEVHSAVKVAKPKQSTVPAVPGFNKGVVSVPGPKGKGDVVPAMLTPGEAVIPADKAQKYASLINAMIAGNIPGYEQGLSVGSIAKQLGQPGGRATEKSVNASHVRGFEPREIISTLQKFAELDPDFGELEIEVTNLTPALDKFGNAIEGVIENITSLVKIKDLDPSKEMYVQGKAFGGTTIPELQSRNVGAFQAAGISGSPMTLGQQAEAGVKAAGALESKNNLSPLVTEQLEALVAEGKIATANLKKENAATLDLAYTKEQATLGLEFAINKDTSSGMSPSEAKSEAELRVSKVLAQYEQDIRDGFDESEAVERAQIRLQKAMFEASKRFDKANIQVTTAEPGSRDSSRPHATTGAPRGGLSLQDTSQKVARGRDTATAVARMGTVGAESDEDIFLNIAKASRPSAAALAAATEAGQLGGDVINKTVSKKIKDTVGKDVAKGVKAESSEAVAAGAEVSRRISQSVIAQQPKVYQLPGLRRVTTDINVYEQHMKDFSEKQGKLIGNIIRQHNSLGEGLKNYFGKIKGIGPAFDVNTQEKVPNTQEKVPASGTRAQPGGFQALNSQLMTLSFAFSSISSVAGMFGTEMGFLNEMMFGASNAMFALTGISQLLIIAKGAEVKAIFESIVATKAKTLAFIKNTLATNANTGAKLFDGGLIAGFKKLGTSLATTFPALGKFAAGLTSLGSVVVRLIPIIGIAATAFIAFKFIADTIEKQKQKIEGMGKAAFMAGERLAELAKFAGFEPTRDPGQKFKEATTARQQGLSSAEATEVVQLQDTQEFKDATTKNSGAFFQDVKNLRNMTMEEAEIALQSLMVQLTALAPEGTDVSTIKTTVAALAAAAGQGNINLDLPVQLNPFEAGNEKRVADYVKTLADSMSDEIGEIAPKVVVDLDPAQRAHQLMMQGFAEPVDEGGPTEEQKEMIPVLSRGFGSAMSSSIEQLNTQLAAGKLSVENYETAVDSVFSSLEGFPYEFVIGAQDQMFRNFGVPENVIRGSLAGITNVESRILALNALSAGVGISEDDFKILDAGDDTNASQEDKNAAIQLAADLTERYTANLADQAAAVKKLQDAEKSKQATLDLSTIETQIDQNKTILENSPKLVAAGLSEKEALDALTDATWANIFAQAQLEDIQAGGGTKFLDEAVSAYNALKTSTDELTGAQERAAGSTAIEEHRNKLQEQNSVLAWLTTNGMSVSDALTVIGDSTLLAGAKAKMSTGDYEDFVKVFTEIQKLSDNLTTRSGTAEKTPLQKAIEQLTGQRDEIRHTNIAFKKLTAAGFSAGKAFDLSQDPILAAAIATTKVGSAGWERLVKALRATNREIEKKAIQDLIKGKVFEVTNLEKQASVSAALEKLGYSYEQIQDIISDETALNMLSKDLKDGKLNAKDTLGYLINIKKIANQEILLNLTTKEGAANEFEKLYDKAVGFLQEQKTELEIKFKFKSASDEAIVNAAQDQIAGINFKIDDYEADLFRIEEQEEEINKEYEKRVEALDEVSKFNDKIAMQQKSQLSIAGALASGDIAAAAAAIQQLNTEKAQEAIEERKKRLEESKERSLAALTGNTGKTRLQLETAIKDLKKEIFDIEEDILEPANERIRLIEVEKRDALASLDAQISKWEDLQNKVNLAKLKLTTKEMEAMEYQANLIKDLLANWDNIEDKQKTLTIIKKTLETVAASGTTGSNPVPAIPVTTGTGGSSGSSKTSSGSGAPASNGSGSGRIAIAPITPAEMERIIPRQRITRVGGGGGSMRFLADGGSVFGSGSATSDSIPAMLSNGEYVIKASSVSKLGLDFLDFVNKNGQIPGFKGGGYKLGGMVRPSYFNAGGFARGTDTIPAMLSPGEFVMRKSAVDRIGAASLARMNAGVSPFASRQVMPSRGAFSSMVMPSLSIPKMKEQVFNVGSSDASNISVPVNNSNVQQTTTKNLSSVYNYNLSVNVKSDANPDQIAKTVMGQIRQVNSQGIRSNRF